MQPKDSGYSQQTILFRSRVQIFLFVVVVVCMNNNGAAETTDANFFAPKKGLKALLLLVWPKPK